MSVSAEYKRALWMICATLNIAWWSALALQRDAPLKGSIGASSALDLACHGLSASLVGSDADDAADDVTRLWWSCHARSLNAETTAESMRRSHVKRSGRRSPLGGEWEPVIAQVDLQVTDRQVTELKHRDPLESVLTLYALPRLPEPSPPPPGHSRERRGGRGDHELSDERSTPELWDSYGVAYAISEPKSKSQNKSLAPEKNKSLAPENKSLAPEKNKSLAPENWIFAHRLSYEGEIAILTPERGAQRRGDVWSRVVTLTTVPSSERLLALRADEEGWSVWSRTIDERSDLVRRSGAWRSEVVVTDRSSPPHGGELSSTPWGVIPHGETARVIWRSGETLTLGDARALGEPITLSSDARAELRRHTELTHDSLLASGGVRPWITRSTSPWRWSPSGERLERHPGPERCLSAASVSGDREGALIEADMWGAMSAQTRPHLTWDQGERRWRFTPLSDVPSSSAARGDASVCAWRADLGEWVYPGGDHGALRWIPLGGEATSEQKRELWINDHGDYQLKLREPPTSSERLRVSAARRGLELARLTGQDASTCQLTLWLAQRWSLYGLGLWSALLALRLSGGGSRGSRGSRGASTRAWSAATSLLMSLCALAISVMSWVALGL